MVYSVQALLVFASAATRDARLAQAQSLIQNKPRWGDTHVTPVDNLAINVLSLDTETRVAVDNAISLSARFEAKSDQVLVRGQFQALDLQPGSWIRWHDCPHDEDIGVCVPDGYWAVP